MPKDENVIFYCSRPHDEGATEQAQKYFCEGFVNARILQGGVEAWKEAGYNLRSFLNSLRRDDAAREGVDLHEGGRPFQSPIEMHFP